MESSPYSSPWSSPESRICSYPYIYLCVLLVTITIVHVPGYLIHKFRVYEAKIEESEKAGSRFITSKSIYFQREARCSERTKLLTVYRDLVASDIKA